MITAIQNHCIYPNYQKRTIEKQNNMQNVMSPPADSVSFGANNTTLLKELRAVSLGLLDRAAVFHDSSNIALNAISNKIVSFKQRAFPNQYIKHLTKDGKIIHILKDHPLTNLRQNGPVARFLVTVSPRNVDIFAPKLPENALVYFIDENGIVTRNTNKISLSMLTSPSEFKDDFKPVTDKNELSALVKYMQELNKDVSEGLASRCY